MFTVLNTPNQSVTIEAMPELDEMITTAEASRLAKEAGKPLTTAAITTAIRRGKDGNPSGIVGAVKLWDNEKAPWLIPRQSFLEWLNAERKPGPKS